MPTEVGVQEVSPDRYRSTPFSALIRDRRKFGGDSPFAKQSQEGLLILWSRQQPDADHTESFPQESIGLHVRTTNLPACFIKADEADTCGLAIVTKKKKVAS
jgi:hypothetical protein